MARPIESTPVLTGEDAARLLASLDGGASEEEMQRRYERAKKVLDDLDSGCLVINLPANLQGHGKDTD